jgi:Flp pilus assembly pilin Flp
VRPRTRFGERGASAVEYAILVAAIAAVIAVVVYALGGHVEQLFDVDDFG